MAFVLMGGFTSRFLGEPWSWTRSPLLLSLCGLYLVVSRVVKGYGNCMLKGVKFTMLHRIMPFILVARQHRATRDQTSLMQMDAHHHDTQASKCNLDVHSAANEL